MAGHNKWSKIKRQKAAADKKKSKIWARIIREITVAARDGGGDPEMNPSLALAIEKAKSENMPKDNIERAVLRGTGELEDGGDYEEVTYEGYAPSGVALFIEALTDNTNRTVADLRHLFGKHGGSLGKAGSVAYLFDRKGKIEIPAEGIDELELFELVVEAGAEDMVQEEGMFVVTTPVEQFNDVETALHQADLKPEEAKLVRIPTTTVRLDPDDARKVLDFVEKIDDHDDVQDVFTTLDEESALATA
ncbi:MAG: YebC/PmpR family DNA-binding transcriptional regulator [Bacteroidetes bacterium]|jgi:YebC/PmpR family DNA-binding regulatory protein|nr:YebC/PmpR family DNA-binding transcriptional regulator [Bacteroidota bacterium]